MGVGNNSVLIFPYISSDDLTIEGANFSNPLDPDRYPFKMDVNITSIDRYDRSGAHIILKCRNNLGVTGLRPPPGGAHDAINTTSDTYMNRNFFKS